MQGVQPVGSTDRPAQSRKKMAEGWYCPYWFVTIAISTLTFLAYSTVTSNAAFSAGVLACPRGIDYLQWFQWRCYLAVGQFPLHVALLFAHRNAKMADTLWRILFQTLLRLKVSLLRLPRVDAAWME